MNTPSHASRKPRILFALIDSGMGHKAPALAVREELERVAPGRFDVVLVDLLAELGLTTLDKVIKKGWSDVFLRYAWLVDLLYWPNHVLAPIVVTVAGWILTPQLRKLERFTRKMAPDLVVTTHFATTNPYGMLRKRRRVGVPVVGVVVDPFENNRIMANPGLDAVVTFSRRSATAYRRVLPSSTRVLRFDFPVSGRFIERAPSRAAARRKLGVAAEPFVLLMATGAEGVGNVDDLPRFLVRAALDLHIIVVCGRNEELRRKLVAMAREAASSGTSRTRCTVFGFVENMHELMTACDVFLGAGGANLTFEALCAGRPAILTFSMPHCRGTLEYVERNGFGWRCGDLESCVALIARLRRKPELLRDAEARIARAGIRSGTPALASWLAGMAGAAIPERAAAPRRGAAARRLPARAAHARRRPLHGGRSRIQ